MIHSHFVKKIFNKSVNHLSDNRASHMINPLKDFTRNRKLNFKTMIHSIITMGASSI